MTRRALLSWWRLLLALPVPASASTAYISLANDQVISIDAASGRRGEPVGARGEMVVTPDNKTVYVLGSSGVRPLDTASNTMGAAIPVPGGRARSPSLRTARSLLVTSTGATR